MDALPVIEVDERNFQREVVDISRKVPVLVDFWATWCGPCKTLGPTLERLARDSGGRLRLAKVDVDREPRLATMFQVQSIPFVVAFQGGRPVDAFVGALDEPGIRQFLARIGVDLAAEPKRKEAPASPAAEAMRALRQRQLGDLPQILDTLRRVEEDHEDFAAAQRIVAAEPFLAGALAGTGPAADGLRNARQAWLDGRDEKALELLLESVAASPRFADELGRRSVVALLQLHADKPELVERIRRRLAVLMY